MRSWMMISGWSRGEIRGIQRRSFARLLPSDATKTSTTKRIADRRSNHFDLKHRAWQRHFPRFRQQQSESAENQRENGVDQSSHPVVQFALRGTKNRSKRDNGFFSLNVRDSAKREWCRWNERCNKFRSRCIFNVKKDFLSPLFSLFSVLPQTGWKDLAGVNKYNEKRSACRKFTNEINS